MSDELEYLREFCTSDRQREVLSALRDHGGNRRDAATALGLTSERAVYGMIKRLKVQAARAGKGPEYGTPGAVPPGYALKGTSQLVDDTTGETRMTWYKTDADKQAAIEAVVGAIESACEGIKPRPPIKAPRRANVDVCSVYNITDYHIGMYAWRDETGDDWDTHIAESLLVQAFEEMILTAPDSELGIFAQMGDFLHWDGLLALTPASKHVLDADTRFDRLAEVAIRVSIQIVEMLLVKHKRVLVITAEGNHDEAGSVWLRKVLKFYFAKNKRVEVDDTPFPYYATLWGHTMIAWHHGHKKAHKALPGLFASEPRYREMWGQAKYTWIFDGHYHRGELEEDNGARTERLPTLAARDAYAARGGWVSWRATPRIDFHKTRGELSRYWFTPTEGE